MTTVPSLFIVTVIRGFGTFPHLLSSEFGAGNLSRPLSLSRPIPTQTLNKSRHRYITALTCAIASIFLLGHQNDWSFTGWM